MLKMRPEGNALIIETAVATLRLDAERGGQLTQLDVKDALFTHPLLANGNLAPGLQFVVDGKTLRLADTPARLNVVSETPERIMVQTTATVGGLFQIEFIYEFFGEGAVFCEMGIDVVPGQHASLSSVSFDVALDTASVKSLRWGCFTRDWSYKRDATGVHAFTRPELFKPREKVQDVRQISPLVSVDMGWEATRFFSNRLEFIMEDWTAFDDGPFENTRTSVVEKDGVWNLRWFFFDGTTIPITGPMRYRNKWAIMFGAARVHRGEGIDNAVRNNVLGSRICHCMYPYVRQGDRWPWASMPIKQVSVQPPQFFKGNPEISRVDEAAELGADTMIIHQFWMSNPGSNNEPSADYHVFDPDWLKAFVGRCHERNMPVLLYCRGTEMYQHYSSFFEDYMQRDYDGLYPDWATPFSMGYVKCSPLHFSAYNYFMFIREQRRRVGPSGRIIGHTGIACFLSVATFDASLGGEFTVRHDELLGSPEGTSYYGLLDCVGGHLISGNLPDREAFSGRKALSVCSAFGMTGHPFMEPNGPFSGPMAYIKPLWDTMRSVDGTVNRLHNPAYSPTRAIVNNTELFPSLFQTDAGQAVMLITNLGAEPGNGVVELNLNELDVPKGAKIQPLNIDGVAPCRVDGNSVVIENLPPLYFAAVKIG
ncbi:MAG: hypothetical protein ACYC6A_02200 [Armatimonadota bacterium]